MNAAQLAKLDSATVKYADAIIAAFARFHIDTPLRQAHALAQLAHESAGFTAVSENLNYSADALGRIFGKYFPTKAFAEQYARQPERIANRVYADRMGNGQESSGDGWKYRGRGLVQLTGKDNYRKASLDLFSDARLLSTPDLVAGPEAACLTAAWFWNRSGLNKWADLDDLEAVTRRVNGGLNGLEDRRQWLDRAKDCIA